MVRGNVTQLWIEHETLVVMGVDTHSTDRTVLTRAGNHTVEAAVSTLRPHSQGLLEYLDSGAPVWKSRSAAAPLFVSIAHTGQYAVGAASTTPVGIDVERSDRDVSRLFRALTLAERDLLPQWGLLEILCAKEAAGKAQQVGLAGSLQRWEVSVHEDRLVVTDRDAASADLRAPWKISYLYRNESGIPLTCAIAVPK